MKSKEKRLLEIKGFEKRDNKIMLWNLPATAENLNINSSFIKAYWNAIKYQCFTTETYYNIKTRKVFSDAGPAVKTLAEKVIELI